MGRSNTIASIRADLLRRAGRHVEAQQWYLRALDRAGSDPARQFLRRRLAECGGRAVEQ
jgi:RNA polymerase sigma-70 factor (ECF subfamily)